MSGKPKKLRLAYVEYSADGAITIFGNREGSPRFTGAIPAPDINTKTLEARLKRYKDACDDLTLQGYFIISRRLVCNTAFDKRGQKTTMKVIYRPCKNEDEAKKVKKEICEISHERQTMET